MKYESKKHEKYESKAHEAHETKSQEKLEHKKKKTFAKMKKFASKAEDMPKVKIAKTMKDIISKKSRCIKKHK